MGGTFSSGRGDTTAILNTILRGMFSRADLIDLYSMADPSKCSKYIVATSTALEKMFAKVRLYPNKKDGEIFFQKLEGIEKTNPNKEEQRKYCTELSFFFIRIFQIYGAITLTIIDSEIPDSYPESAMRERGDLGKRVIFYDRRAGIAGLPPNTRPPFRLFGGSLTNTFLLDPRGNPLMSLYTRILNTNLKSPDDPNSSDDMIVESFPEIHIAQGELYDNIGAGRTTKTNIGPVNVIYSSLRDPPVTITTTMALKEEGGRLTIELRNTTAPGKTPLASIETSMTNTGGTYRNGVKLFPQVLKELLDKAHNRIDPPPFNAGEFLYRKRIIPSKDIQGQQIPTTDIYIDDPRIFGNDLDIQFKQNRKFDDRSRNIKIKTSISIKRGDNKGRGQEYSMCVRFDDIEVVPEELARFVDIREYDETASGERCRGKTTTFYTGADDNGTPTNSNGLSIPSYLQRVFTKIIRETEGEEWARNGVRYSANGTPIPYDSGTIEDSLKIKWLWESLRKNPPVKAHCIGRAMQLLNPNALKNGILKDSYTSVCKTKFAWIQNGSLPKPGEGITSALGIKALSVLFVKLIDGNMKIDEKDEKFNRFKRQFQSYFERLENEPEVTGKPPPMDKIYDKLLPGCRDKGDASIDLEPSGAGSTLKGYTNQLISRQAQHLVDSMNIIFMLFNEAAVRGGRYELSDYVIQGGMDALNDIGERARIILAEYYGDCEKTYKEALYYLHFSGAIRPTPKAAAPTTRRL